VSNPDYDALLSTTYEKYAPTFVDNIFDEVVLYSKLMAKGKVKTIDGGESITEPLMYGDNSTFGTYSGYETLDTTPQDGITAANFPWKQAAVNIAISGIEEAKNKGASKIISLLEAKTFQAEESARAGMNLMGYGDGTGNAGKDFLGLEALVGDETGVATVGGIDCTVGGNEYWRSVVQTADTDGAGADTTVRDTAQWSNVFYTASRGNDAPDLVITTQALFEHYEASLEPQLRFTSNDKADAKFTNIEFKGRSVFFDADCPAGTTYFLNTKYLGVKGHKDVWWTPTGFRTLPDVDARWSNILAYGNMTVSNRARQGKITGQTVV